MRDSVAAGDDACAPHEQDVEVRAFLEPVAFVNQLYPSCLPHVAGAGHAWRCLLNGRCVATVTVRGVAAEVPEVEYAREANHVHFAYLSASW